MSDSCNPMDCSLPGSSVHGVSQARILEWVAISFSKGSFWPRDQTWVSCIAGRFFTDWAPEKPTAIISLWPTNAPASLVHMCSPSSFPQWLRDRPLDYPWPVEHWQAKYKQRHNRDLLIGHWGLYCNALPWNSELELKEIQLPWLTEHVDKEKYPANPSLFHPSQWMWDTWVKKSFWIVKQEQSPLGTEEPPSKVQLRLQNSEK